PRVGAVQEVVLHSLWGRTGPLHAKLDDLVGDHVADEGAAAVRAEKVIGGVIGDAGDGRRALVLRQHFGAEAARVGRLAEAGVAAAAQQLVDRLTVAVARVEVAERVERQAEGVHLAPGELLDAGAIGLDAVGVARFHGDRRTVAGLDGGLVGKAVADV